jgi:hypothetical protein
LDVFFCVWNYESLAGQGSGRPGCPYCLHDRNYLDSEDIDGNLQEQCQRSLAFIKRNLHRVQRQQGFDTLVQPKLPEEVFEDTRRIFCPAALGHWHSARDRWLADDHAGGRPEE